MNKIEALIIVACVVFVGGLIYLGIHIQNKQAPKQKAYNQAVYECVKAGRRKEDCEVVAYQEVWKNWDNIKDKK